MAGDDIPRCKDRCEPPRSRRIVPAGAWFPVRGSPVRGHDGTVQVRLRDHLARQSGYAEGARWIRHEQGPEAHNPSRVFLRRQDQEDRGGICRTTPAEQSNVTRHYTGNALNQELVKPGRPGVNKCRARSRPVSTVPVPTTVPMSISVRLGFEAVPILSR
jgi:hypothetical protein